MVQHKCSKCGYIAASKRDLNRHHAKKFPCDQAQFKCKKCARPFHSQGSMYNHQKDCEGRHQTVEEKDQQIESLKDALAASSGLNHEIRVKQQKIINNNTQNNITINDVKNITQNIVIWPVGSENIDHLKKLSMEELKDKIGMDRDPQTHVEAFKMIRLDPEHPENHNILLTDRDSDKILFIADENGWQEGEFTFNVRNAIFDTNKNIQNLIPYKEREGSEYYWNHLVRGIGAACNERNDAVLKPIFEGIRDPLHQATLRLMNIDSNISDDSRNTSPKRERIIDADLASIIEQEKTKRMEMTEKTKQLELTERTRQLELQVELARLQKA